MHVIDDLNHFNPNKLYYYWLTFKVKEIFDIPSENKKEIMCYTRLNQYFYIGNIYVRKSNILRRNFIYVGNPLFKEYFNKQHSMFIFEKIYLLYTDSNDFLFREIF